MDSLYGRWQSGGANGAGTIFRITLGGAFTVLHTFTFRTDGRSSWSPLDQGSDGNFYGTTNSGGASFAGTVFRMSSAGVFTVLHAVTGRGDGGVSFAGLIQATDGDFYGTTYAGGASFAGTVFQITP